MRRDDSSLAEQDIGKELLAELEKITSDNAPIPKGSLAQFSDFLAKNNAVLAAIVTLIGKLVIGV